MFIFKSKNKTLFFVFLVIFSFTIQYFCSETYGVFIEKGNTEPLEEISIITEDITSPKAIYTNPSSFDGQIPKSITPTPGWTVITATDFESTVFPPPGWTVIGNPAWGRTCFKPYTETPYIYPSSCSAWCGRNGTYGIDPFDFPYYDNLMNTELRYGPFSLANATQAKLRFWHWTRTESTYDYFGWYVSIDGTNYYGTRISGTYYPWKCIELDFSNVPVLGNILGAQNVYVKFKFTSDVSVFYEGTFLDDIIIEKNTNPRSTTQTVFTNPSGSSKQTNLGQPVYLESKLTSDNVPISNRNVDFYIQISGTWQKMSGSPKVTDSNGIAYIIYTPPPNLATGNYPIRTKFDGDATFSSSYSDKTLAIKKAQWTIMVYLDADNDLEIMGVWDFYYDISNVMNTNINIIVLFDRASGYATDYGNWTSTRKYYVTPELSVYIDMGELNMGNPNTLYSFVASAKTDLPANNYALVLWNHGNGWKNSVGSTSSFNDQGAPIIPKIEAELDSQYSTITKNIVSVIPEYSSKTSSEFKLICYDVASNDYLTMSELSVALNAITNNGANKLQIIDFDACLMGMVEVAYQLRNHALIMVGSEDNVPGPGLPYYNFMTPILSTTTAPQLATLMVQKYGEFYNKFGIQATLAAISLTYLPTFNTKLIDFSQALISKMPNINSGIKNSWNLCEKFGDKSYMDLGSFAFRISKLISDTAIQGAANQLILSLNNLKIYEWHSASYTYNTSMKGLAIYFPPEFNNVEWSNYINPNYLDFPSDSAQKWDDFLYKLFIPTITSFNLDNGANVTRDRDVTLNFTTTNNPTHYMASLASDFSDAVWTPIPTSPPNFTLSSSYSYKKVFLKVKNSMTESASVYDYIWYIHPSAPELLTFAINNGAACTSNQTVKLNNTANNSPTHYRTGISGADLVANNNWLPYSNQPNYDLTAGYGNKLVYLQLKNSYGVSNYTYDYINYQATCTSAPMELPVENMLNQNYPNPFNPETWIPYQLKENANVEINIYTIGGQLVRKLELGYKSNGFYNSKDKSAYWDGKNDYGEYVNSGIYFYTIKAGNFLDTKKMIIMK
ncbi:TPA: T9SS type A sorting domain-containing protein [bacterium]|nr:T9SS type A sorting domain-containing protein [bacterium]